MMATMCSLTQRLLDYSPTIGTILAGVVRWDSNCHHTKYLAEILQPIAESRPGSIRYRLRQFPVFNHVTHHQVLIGNQVVRLDYASCQLYDKIFTLPTYLKVLFTQATSRFGSIVRVFWGSTHL